MVATRFKSRTKQQRQLDWRHQTGGVVAVVSNKSTIPFRPFLAAAVSFVALLSLMRGYLSPPSYSYYYNYPLFHDNSSRSNVHINANSITNHAMDNERTATAETNDNNANDRQQLKNPPLEKEEVSSFISSFISFGASPIEGPQCTATTECLWATSTSSTSSMSRLQETTVYTCDGQCSSHATCYFGTCLCHPGYTGITCDQSMEGAANPWYTADCPNLQAPNTLTVDTGNNNDPSRLGGIVDCSNGLHEDVSLGTGLSYCAYLCYSNEAYGTAIVPKLLWEKAQEAENKLWKMVAQRAKSNDRYKDHFQGFANYHCIPATANLGHVLEVGAGPWTQFRGLLHHRPTVQVDSFTILEPGADFYVTQVGSCAYQSGKLAMYPDTSKFHEFPIHIQSKLGESATTSDDQFDTVMVVNVIEHVQNAVDFLHGIHKSLKPGGLLIFHDRYYDHPEAGDAVLGRNVFHPIRLTKKFFDHFLSDFDILYNNCEGEKTIQGWKQRNKGERGYYVMARKKDS